MFIKKKIRNHKSRQHMTLEIKPVLPNGFGNMKCLGLCLLDIILCNF